MNVIYRVYEKDSTEWDGKIILDQSVCCCNSREHFKEIMRDLYKPKNIYFANSKKLIDGDIFVSIISEDCYNVETYLNVQEYQCACCDKTFKANKKLLHSFSDYVVRELRDICAPLFEKRKEEFKDMVFCSRICQEEKNNRLLEEFKNFAKENDMLSEEWISKDSFNISDKGYIYMITKKSTGEFYVGQTKYVPIFRWGQHLLTDRFKLENINDYKFEVLEIVIAGDLLTREAHWINKKRDENPSLSLNIQIPKEKLENE